MKVQVHHWHHQPLRDLVDRVFDRRGVTPEKLGSSFLARGHRVVSAKHIKGGRIDLQAGEDRFVDSSTHARWMGTPLLRGDVIVTSEAPLGEVAFIPRTLDWCLGQRLFGLRPLAQALDGRFLYYALKSAPVQADIQGRATGTVAQGIRQPELLAVSIPLPPIKEQQAIGAVLGALDDKIELNRRTNETLEAMARALFQSWFVDFDPVRAKMKGRQPEGMDAQTAKLFPRSLSSFGGAEMPANWSLASLAQLTTKIGSGATPRGAAYAAEGISFIRSQNVYDSEFVWEGLVKIDEDAADALRGVTVQPDDVLLNITGASILRTCVVEPGALPARVNQHVAIVRARPGVPPRFLHLHLLRSQTKSFLLGMDAGASRQAVTKAHIEAVEIVTPPQTLLDRFRTLTEPLYLAIDARRAASRALAGLRDALLPKLLSGELRISAAERTVSAAL